MKTLKEGDKAPDFVALDQDGKQHQKSDYAGKKLIIFFYPKANTPGCTAQACNLSDHFTILKQQGYEILGVSADAVKQQKNFSTKFNFPFPLLADTEKQLIEAFGVWGPKKFRGKEYDGIHRVTFIIDEQGIIERVIDKVKTKEHAAQILE